MDVGISRELEGFWALSRTLYRRLNGSITSGDSAFSILEWPSVRGVRILLANAWNSERGVAALWLTSSTWDFEGLPTFRESSIFQ